MFDNIKIDVSNFALIKKGEFEVEDILIIENMQGYAHADILKVIFSLLITYSPEGDFSGNTMVKTELSKVLEGNLSLESSMDFMNFMHLGWDEYNVSQDYFNEKYGEFKELLKKHKIKTDNSIIELAISKFNEYDEYHMPVFQHFLELEFKKHFIDYYAPFDIHIYIDGEEHFLTFDSSKSNILNMGFSYKTEKIPGNVMYLGSRPITDFNAYNINLPYHYEELFSTLTEPHAMRKLDL